MYPNTYRYTQISNDTEVKPKVLIENMYLKEF